MYTRAIINSHLLTILVPIILYVVSIIVGIVLHFVFPEDKKRLVPKKEFKEIYNLYISKFDLNSIEDKNVLPLLNKEKTKRLVALIIEIVICLFCLTMVLCFLFNLSFYSSDGNLIKEMINIVAHILPFVVLAYGISLAYIYFVESSYKRSIEAIKSSKLQKNDINKSNSNKMLE